MLWQCQVTDQEDRDGVKWPVQSFNGFRVTADQSVMPPCSRRCARSSAR